jgi:hypothetical protein
MLTAMNHTRTLFPCLLLVLACSRAMAADTPIDMSLAAGKADEACMKLRVGDTLVWRFDADAPVDFIVHHHVGADVKMPVDVKQARRHEGRLVADHANDWCLMWTAGPAARARVKGAWSVTAKP